MKTCNKCRRTMPIDCFGRDRQRPDGHLNSCKDCRNKAERTRRSDLTDEERQRRKLKRNQRDRAKYKKLPDEVKEKRRQYRFEWRENNREKWRSMRKAWRDKNPDKCREMGMRWQKDNPEKVAGYRRKAREELRDSYIKQRIVHQSEGLLSTSDIPQILIETKRAELQITRILKQKK